MESTPTPKPVHSLPTVHLGHLESLLAVGSVQESTPGTVWKGCLGCLDSASLPLFVQSNKTSLTKQQAQNSLQAPPVSPMWFINMAHTHFRLIHEEARDASLTVGCFLKLTLHTVLFLILLSLTAST